jgi:hypothetical protein
MDKLSIGTKICTDGRDPAAARVLANVGSNGLWPSCNPFSPCQVISLTLIRRNTGK